MLLRSLAVAAFVLASPAALALDVGDTAPCVELENRQPNGTFVEQCIRTRDDGQSFTLIEFFSITCTDCAANRPIITTLGDEIAATTKTRFVSIDRNRNAVLSYIGSHTDVARFPVAFDLERNAKRAYQVDATPTLFLLDRNEKVLFKHQGVLASGDVARIKQLVGQ